MKQVLILVPAGKANLSSIVGSFEILSSANEYWQRIGNKPMMEIRIAGLITEQKMDAGYLSIYPENIAQFKYTDLLIIPSVSDPEGYDHLIENNLALINWIGEQYKNGAEIASICTGAFLLAATGLLEGKSCSTHWNAANDFKRMFPSIDLHVDRLLTVGQGIYTNGGAFSFLNMVLFLVEKFFDRQTAIYCSKVFQIDIERTSQSPFFIFEPQKNHGDELIWKAQAYIEGNLPEKISFEKLASKLAISRRNFDRRFINATGNTPAEYSQRVKMEVAKSILEKGRKSIVEVMNEVGYSDERAFRDVFRRITGLSPAEYKAKYNKPIPRTFITILVICLIGICGLSSCATKLYQRQIAGNITYPEPLPDTTPMTFLPDIVPTDSSNLNSAFSADGKSFYFSREISGKYKIHFTRYDGKNWTKAAVAPFSDNNYSNADPAFAPDGKLYFISNRPKKESDTSSDYDIWFVKPLSKGRWSKPVNLQIVNSDSDDYYVSFSKNGNLYFASSRRGGFGQEDLYVSKLVSGRYSVPENLGAVINSSKSEYDPGISPNEDFIVFTASNRVDGFGAGDLYYATLGDNKKWGTPVNAGRKINTKAREYCSYISPDLKYLFFTSGGNIKWVSIRAITTPVK